MIRLDPTKIIRIYPTWWPAKVQESEFSFVEAQCQLSSLIAMVTKLTDAYTQLMLSASSHFSSEYKRKKKAQYGKQQAVRPHPLNHKVYSAPTFIASSS